MEETDVIFLWGANARDNHPIMFHHVLKGVHRGARLYVVDPRRTPSAAWGDRWLGLNVGTDIALSNAMAREIIHAGLENQTFIQNATAHYDAYRAHVEPYTLDYVEGVTGVPAAVIREVALDFARADRAMICWTLGITEHHNAVDNVCALINLALLTGHVGRYGSGVNPLRGQNNVQGGGDMGAIPNRLVGFQDILDPAVRARFNTAWGITMAPTLGLTMTEMFEAMHEGHLHGLYVIGENPAQSEANQTHTQAALSGLDILVVQDIFFTRTAEFADVVLPASSSWCEADGTVTNSERRVQRVRKALEPPGDARDDMWIIAEVGKRLGVDIGPPIAEVVWNEVRSLAPEMFGGMSYARLEAEKGLQWPCASETDPGALFLHERLWATPRVGPPAPFSLVDHAGPVEMPDADYPFQLTTGRRLDSFNTGVQSGGYTSPLRRPETLDLSPEDAARLGLGDGDVVRITSRRGTVVAPIRIDPSLRAGLVFMTLHFQDQVRVNLLTTDVWDPKSGVSEFKACAVKLEAVIAADATPLAAERELVPGD
jgi:predicted molibdopterin-dependent oxidoreductase YjgC